MKCLLVSLGSSPECLLANSHPLPWVCVAPKLHFIYASVCVVHSLSQAGYISLCLGCLLFIIPNVYRTKIHDIEIHRVNSWNGNETLGISSSFLPAGLPEQVGKLHAEALSWGDPYTFKILGTPVFLLPSLLCSWSIWPL